MLKNIVYHQMLLLTGSHINVCPPLFYEAYFGP